MWNRLYAHKDLDQEVAWTKELATRSKARSSLRKYASYWSRFKAWAEKKGICCLPADPEHVAIYLADASKTKSSISVCNARFYAIRWMHEFHGFDDPCTHKIPKMVLEGCRRDKSRRKASSTRIPFPREKLLELCSWFATENASLRDLRICAMAILAFAAFLRIGEILELRRADVKFENSFINIKIRTSKTDSYNTGNEVVICSGDTSASPEAVLRKYFNGTDMHSAHGESYLFRPLVPSNDGFMLVSDTRKKLSYNRAREELAHYLSLLNLEHGKYSWHCLRHGGATAAAEANVPDRLFKGHGRWRSEAAKDGYVHESLFSRLLVSKSLKL